MNNRIRIKQKRIVSFIVLLPFLMQAAFAQQDISLVNIDAAKMQGISININGTKCTSVSGRILSSQKLQDYNLFQNPSTIKPTVFNDVKLTANSLQVKFPPFFVVELTLK